jgi:hypothetical protein
MYNTGDLRCPQRRHWCVKLALNIARSNRTLLGVSFEVREVSFFCISREALVF